MQLSVFYSNSLKTVHKTKQNKTLTTRTFAFLGIAKSSYSSFLNDTTEVS